MFVCVRPGLKPGVTNTCSHRAYSSGSVARYCMLVHVKSDLASEPGAAYTCSHRACSLGSEARYHTLLCVRSDLASEPGAAYTCSHRDCSPGSVARYYMLVCVGQTWPQSQVLPLHVHIELAALTP